jgi:hypothetical protein
MPEHNRLAVNGEALGFDTLGSAAMADSRAVQSWVLRL